MKRVKTKTKKLQLTKETLMRLSSKELAQIVGGDTDGTCAGQSAIIVECLTITQNPNG